jgi:hypothetical protein
VGNESLHAHEVARIQAVLRQIALDLNKYVHEPMYLIGSAAACLAGAAVTVDDLDLLSSREDAERLERAWQARRIDAYQPGDAPLFRSRFARYAFPAMAVEVMGGLQVHQGGCWSNVLVGISVPLPDSLVRLPTIGEQLRLLAMFGRPKDYARAERLRMLSQGVSR